MSFPIPYQRLRFLGFGSERKEQVSGVNAVNTLLGNTSPKNRFRLILYLGISFGLSGGSVATFEVDLYRGPPPTTEIELVSRASLTAAAQFFPPLGDANVATSEFQGYPIPWFPEMRLRVVAAAAGAGETTTITYYMEYLEWEILKE